MRLIIEENEIKIEKAQPQDIDSIKILELEGGLSWWSEADYLAAIKRKDTVFLTAKSNFGICGFIIMRLIMNQEAVNQGLTNSEMEAEILNIAVKKKYRERKIATKLLHTALTICITDSCNIYLEVRESNLPAQIFYRKNGFRIIGRRKNYYSGPNEDAILMSARIEPRKKA